MSDLSISSSQVLLVVDRDAKSRLLPGLILRPFGVVVYEAKTGAEAISLAAKYKPEFILVGDIPEELNEFLLSLQSSISRYPTLIGYGVGDKNSVFSYYVGRPVSSLNLLSLFEGLMFKSGGYC